MTNEQFLQQFGHFIDAPNGIHKLRELILQLAVQGKLVAQDLKEGSGGELLASLKNEMELLAEEQNIRKSKEHYSANKAEYNLPKNWKSVAIGEICHVKGGKRVPRGYKLLESPTPHAYIRVTDMKDGTVRDNDLRYISEEVHEQISRYTISKNDIYVTIAGTIGDAGKIPEELDGANLTENAAKLIFRGMNRDFLLLTIKSWLVQNQFSNFVNQMAQPKLALRSIASTVVPLPPLPEQHRIVAKVDQLMALCDQLEAERNARETTHQRLIRAVHHPLTAIGSDSAHNGIDCLPAWHRIRDNFADLYTTLESVKALRQTILQLAVQGKLVEQDPNDEPAAVLLKRIEEGRQQRISNNQSKRNKLIRDVDYGEAPFDVPSGWEWCRFGTLVEFKSELVNPGDFMDYEQIAPDSIEKGTGKLLLRRTVKDSGIKGPNNRFYEGQILYSKIRPSLSKAIIAPCGGLCSADMYPLETLVDKEYLLKAILSEAFLEQVRVLENRIKMPKLNVDSLSNILVAVPPLKEQQRIVTKVDELMALCDQLEASIRDKNDTATRYAEAVVNRIAAA